LIDSRLVGGHADRCHASESAGDAVGNGGEMTAFLDMSDGLDGGTFAYAPCRLRIAHSFFVAFLGNCCVVVSDSSALIAALHDVRVFCS
jgi:hypothetical protein